MGDCVKFAVIGDCHYSGEGNYSTRDCLGAKDKVVGIIESLNSRNLDTRCRSGNELCSFLLIQ